MVTSKISGSFVIHSHVGELVSRDLIDSKMFVRASLAKLPEDFGVLWDMRQSFLALPDDSYENLTGALVDPVANVVTTRKRAFLVRSELHQNKFTGTLARVNPPWPWFVSLSYPEASNWLNSGVPMSR